MATASRFIQRLRNVLTGKNLQEKLNNRVIQDVSPRNVPEPNLPDGPSHKLSTNYYFSRDARREVVPNTVVVSQTKRIAAPTPEGGETAVARKPVTPGIGPGTWELSKDEPYL